MRLKNKVALVTGGSNGIGKESCLLFAAEGAKVIVVDINETDGQATVSEIEVNGGEAVFCKADVSKAGDCEKMVNLAKEEFGGLHVLFNNAGIMHSDDGNSQSTTEDVWDLT
ncbi:MAG: SDR family NAD(P)-dependent oxidoreductase, partial [Bacteroidota bacterium]